MAPKKTTEPAAPKPEASLYDLLKKIEAETPDEIVMAPLGHRLLKAHYNKRGDHTELTIIVGEGNMVGEIMGGGYVGAMIMVGSQLYKKVRAEMDEKVRERT